AISSGNNQSADRGVALGSALVAIVKDTYNNVVNAQTINWAVASGGGTLSAATSASGSSGLASITYTLGSTAGTNTVTATINGTTTSVTFTATGNALAFNYHWPFDFNTSSSYDFDVAKIELVGGVARLIASDQIDDDNTSSGFGGATLDGLTFDSANGLLRLLNSGATNRSEHESSWTPSWSSLLGYWKMNENSGTSIADSSGKGATLTVNNSPSLGQAGKLFNAVQMNGSNSYLTAPINLDSYPILSLSFWIYQTSAGAGTLTQIIGNDNGGYDRAIMLNSNTNRTWGIYVGSSEVDTGIPVAINRWQHVLTVFGSSSVKFYLDGNLAYTSGSAASGYSGSNTLQIGRSLYNGGSAYSSARLDDIAVWNAELSAAEIRGIYLRQSALYSGSATSRVLDAKQTSQNWTSLNWMTTLPTLKSLPDFASGSIQNETSTNYSQLVGSMGMVGDNNLMNGIAGLWHLDGTPGTSVPNGTTLSETSGQSSTGISANSNGIGLSYVISPLGTALSLDGTDDSVTFTPTNSMIANNGSVAFWIKSTLDDAQDVIGISNGTNYLYIAVGNNVTGLCSNEMITLLTNESSGERACYTSADRSQL
ncbi:MAG: hypothetical protein EOP04_17730, partial [Proteobacteria bacterium]